MTKIITTSSMSEEIKTDVKIFSSAKDRLGFYRREIRFETTNLSSRTDAFLASQAFLLIAYASSMANLNPQWSSPFTVVVPIMLVLFGIVSSAIAWPGIKASCDIIDHWYSKQSGLLASDTLVGLSYDDSPLFSRWESTDKGHKPALTFSKRAPWFFCILWLSLGGIAIYVNLA